MRKLFALVLAAAMWMGLTVCPAGAAEAGDVWTEYGQQLEAQGVMQYGERPFREGLMPVLVGDQWNYINEQGQVVDLNQNRFLYVFDFFEGLAAVIDKDTFQVGYIDTTGKLVIPCQFGAYDSMGSVFVGYFHDGTATVLEQTSGDPSAMRVGKVNKSGALTSGYASAGGELTGLYLISDSGYMPDELYVEPEPAEGKLEFQIDKYTGFGSMYPGIGEENVFQNGAAYQAIATNVGGKPVSGTYALVSYAIRPHVEADGTQALAAQIHYFDIDLQPGQSESYSIASQFSGLSNGSFRFCWIAFESQAEKAQFDAGVPYAVPGQPRDLDGVQALAWVRDALGMKV